MLVHVAGGGEQSVANVTLVRPQALGVRPGSATVHQDAVYCLQVDVKVPRLGVTPATQPALVGPLVGVAPQVSLQQGGDGEFFITGRTFQWNLQGVTCRGGWRHSRVGGLLPAWWKHSLERLHQLFTKFHR